MVLMTEAFVRKGQDIQQKFFNRMQRMGMAIAAHDEYWVCSRGTGKSEGLEAAIYTPKCLGYAWQYWSVDIPVLC